MNTRIKQLEVDRRELEYLWGLHVHLEDVDLELLPLMKGLIALDGHPVPKEWRLEILQGPDGQPRVRIPVYTTIDFIMGPVRALARTTHANRIPPGIAKIYRDWAADVDGMDILNTVETCGAADNQSRLADLAEDCGFPRDTPASAIRASLKQQVEKAIGDGNDDVIAWLSAMLTRLDAAEADGATDLARQAHKAAHTSLYVLDAAEAVEFVIELARIAPVTIVADEYAERVIVVDGSRVYANKQVCEAILEKVGPLPST